MNKSKFAIFLIIISVFFATIMIACTKLAQLEVNVVTAALLRFIFGIIIISPIIIKSKFSIFKTQNLKFHFVRSTINLPAMLLGFATLIGVVFSDFIVSLLFERGAFLKTDTQNTSAILIMYLVGLVPFGVAKIYSLFLYAKQLQNKAVKATSISLVFNIILSLALIEPFGAVGLALASSLSGFVLLGLTLKEIR